VRTGIYSIVAGGHGWAGERARARGGRGGRTGGRAGYFLSPAFGQLAYTVGMVGPTHSNQNASNEFGVPIM
jgi:hypothetical protein